MTPQAIPHRVYGPDAEGKLDHSHNYVVPGKGDIILTRAVFDSLVLKGIVRAEPSKVLKAFVDAVEGSGGGVQEDKHRGEYTLTGDLEDLHLGTIYVDACLALNRQPLIEPPYRVED